MLGNVKFIVGGNEYNSIDYGLVMKPFNAPTPEPRTAFVTVEGKNGTIDLSEINGLCYNDLSFDIDFTVIDFNRENMRDFLSFINGRRVWIVMPYDETHHYDARVWFDDLKAGNVRTIVCHAKSKPFRLKNTISTITLQNNGYGGSSCICHAGAMPTVPVFDCTKTTTVALNNVSAASAICGTGIIIPEFVFKYGDNKLVFATEGTVTVTWQEGEI